MLVAPILYSDFEIPKIFEWIVPNLKSDKFIKPFQQFFRTSQRKEGINN
jgi:hypothetical protein